MCNIDSDLFLIDRECSSCLRKNTLFLFVPDDPISSSSCETKPGTPNVFDLVPFAASKKQRSNKHTGAHTMPCAKVNVSRPMYLL